MTDVDLRERSAATELMDTEAVDYEDFQRCLRDIETINIMTFAYRPTLRWLARALKGREVAGPVSVLDVGFGHGDMLRRLRVWFRKRGIEADLVGVDVSPWAAKAASRATPSDGGIQYEVANVFALSPEQKFDVIISSLFAHHLNNEELVRFIRWMNSHARWGWFINDLHRHPVPYHVIKHVVRLMRLHRMVLHDAPLSVARGFTRADWSALLTKAGVAADEAQVSWSAPFRYGVGRLA